ncbi:hypothetical protein TCAL_13720 [Tigriopus californicus]|uniref:Invertebrate defensins family profile domain-containing protein n=1 Tax=Tigriopus californicus TaxID=6832 RepID=A0A553PRI5_TIGCA|nr:hypothetical protein TCAL_13720 [Tigriopus californicus]
MKSFMVPVIMALLGFALVTLADFGKMKAEEAQIIDNFESGMFDEFISIETEVNDSDVDDKDLEDMDGDEDRLLQCAWCRLRCMAQCAVAPNGTCTCTKMFLGLEFCYEKRGRS